MHNDFVDNLKSHELFNKLVEAITDDQQIWVRMRKRLQTDNKEEE